MEWGPQQDAALKAVAHWLEHDKDDQQVFRLFGYAGTGKTTLARHFAENFDGKVLFGAFTGKAAYVMKQKGCWNAQTIHSMIYRSNDKSGAYLKDLENQLAVLIEKYGEDSQHSDILKLKKNIKHERESLSRPAFRLNFESEVGTADLVIIDECSMIDGEMAQDLLFFNTPVLVLGDPAQLPPVGGAGYFTENCKPDVMLTEIHRQAQDNPIIHMASLIREGRSLDLGSYGESLIIPKKDLDQHAALSADQIIVGRNATRHAYNKRLRELHNFTSVYPQESDKLVCLRNNKDLGLLNGGIWSTIKSFDPDGERMDLLLEPELGGPHLEVNAHTHYFLGRGDDLPWFERKEAEEFDFGYALTCHKSQGSQWDNVLVMDESWCFRKDRTRWLYTAVTRAAERITLVR